MDVAPPSEAISSLDGNQPDRRGQQADLKLLRSDEGEQLAARLAAACRCEQELRVFMFDPES